MVVSLVRPSTTWYSGSMYRIFRLLDVALIQTENMVRICCFFSGSGFWRYPRSAPRKIWFWEMIRTSLSRSYRHDSISMTLRLPIDVKSPVT